MTNKRVAIMQPYVFPYLGYFQLIESVDTFVFYDDVNFIKQGWINRNKLLLNNREFMFTIPLEDISSFRKINETRINKHQYQRWKKKFLRAITQEYSKAPYFENVYELITLVLTKQINYISELAVESILAVCSYVSQSVDFKLSSENYTELKDCDRQDRLVAMLKEESCHVYINSDGGRKLYNEFAFIKNSINLRFLSAGLPEYKQFNEVFVPGLSIIDVLMFNSISQVRAMLSQYQLS